MTEASNFTTIVVNWNLKNTTERCLRALQESSQPCRTILVDNGSNDGSVEYLGALFPQVEFFCLPDNTGFSHACNQAIQKALDDKNTDYIFLLNNDALVHPDCLGELILAAQTHPKAGIFGPKIYYWGSEKIWYAGARQRRGVLAATDTGRGQMDHGQFAQLRSVDYIFGAAMMIRRSVFESIGLFDERFFLYLEDLDFCLRARAAGFELLFVPQSQVWHMISASTQHNPALRRYYHIHSTLLFLQKHLPSRLMPHAALFWSLVFGRAVLSDLLRGDFHTALASWPALRRGIASLPAMMWKR